MFDIFNKTSKINKIIFRLIFPTMFTFVHQHFVFQNSSDFELKYNSVILWDTKFFNFIEKYNIHVYILSTMRKII